MPPTDIVALGDSQPPHIDHGVVGTSTILIFIHRTCYMAVTVVTENIVHHSLISLVSFKYRLVKLKGVLDRQRHILVSLSKRQVVNCDSIGASEVMDNPIRHCYSCVSNERKEPRDQRKWGPHYAKGEPGLLWVYSGILNTCCRLVLNLSGPSRGVISSRIFCENHS